MLVVLIAMVDYGNGVEAVVGVGGILDCTLQGRSLALDEHLEVKPSQVLTRRRGKTGEIQLFW